MTDKTVVTISQLTSDEIENQTWEQMIGRSDSKNKWRNDGDSEYVLMTSTKNYVARFHKSYLDAISKQVWWADEFTCKKNGIISGSIVSAKKNLEKTSKRKIQKVSIRVFVKRFDIERNKNEMQEDEIPSYARWRAMHSFPNEIKNIYRFTTELEDIIEMETGKGFTATFPASFLDIVSLYIWCSHKKIKRALVYTESRMKDEISGKFRWICLHRLVCGLIGDKTKKVVDHLDGDGNNNKEENLKITTYQRNNMNKRMHIKNKSGRNGVTWNETQKYYLAFFNMLNTETGVRDKRSALFSYDLDSERTQEEAKQLSFSKRQEWDDEVGCTNGVRPKRARMDDYSITT